LTERVEFLEFRAAAYRGRSGLGPVRQTEHSQQQFDPVGVTRQFRTVKNDVGIGRVEDSFQWGDAVTPTILLLQIMY
jgi:hypothetical protein